MASGFAALIAARALLLRGGPAPGAARPQASPRRRRGRRPAGGVFLAEHYLPGVSAETLDVLTLRLRAAAADPRGQAGEVALLGSAGLPEDEALLHFLAAPSPEAVALVCERAGVAADRIVPVVWRRSRGRRAARLPARLRHVRSAG